MKELKTLTNIISTNLANKKYDPIKNQINKFIQKNQNDELLEFDLKILQYFLNFVSF